MGTHARNHAHECGARYPVERVEKLERVLKLASVNFSQGEIWKPVCRSFLSKSRHTR